MGIEFRADKLKKPKNILIVAQIVSYLLCYKVIKLWDKGGLYAGNSHQTVCC